jgi:hypothetical protein
MLPLKRLQHFSFAELREIHQQRKNDRQQGQDSGENGTIISLVTAGLFVSMVVTAGFVQKESSCNYQELGLDVAS